MIDYEHLRRWPLCNVCRRNGVDTPAVTTKPIHDGSSVSLCVECNKKVGPGAIGCCVNGWPFDTDRSGFPPDDEVAPMYQRAREMTGRAREAERLERELHERLPWLGGKKK